MSERRVTDKRPEPTRLLQILRQIEDLNFGDFIDLAKMLEIDPATLHSHVRGGMRTRRERDRTKHNKADRNKVKAQIKKETE